MEPHEGEYNTEDGHDSGILSPHGNEQSPNLETPYC